MEHFSIFLPSLLLAYGAFLLTVLSPGPNVLAVIGTSMAVDRASGLALGMGVATGTLFWSSLSAIGLSQIITSYAWALVLVKVLGGVFLLWLAFKAFRSAASPHEIETQELAGGRRTRRGFYLRGLIINMTNPKAALAWIAIVSLVLKPETPLWVAFALIGGTTAISIVLHAAYAIAFSTPPLVAAYGNCRRVIQGMFGIFFNYAGIKILTSRA